ncbi:class I SAM-dependent methyltransferase [bacterium]|nr:class I SAM-dependent methyltransferase [bacterium]
MNDEFIQHAEAWASSLWKNARDRWTGRTGQDRNYRSHVIHPALAEILMKLYPGGPVHVLDLGCGDGVFVGDAVGRGILDSGGSYTGVDISADFIARMRMPGESGRVDFIEGNLTDPGFPEKILARRREWNCIVSVFTVQEIPGLGSFMENLRIITPERAHVVIVTVHPDFADWLLDNGRINPAESLGKPSGTAGEGAEAALWRWAGEYPIVDEPNEAFYLPYFHRTIHDYRLCFARAGFTVEQVIALPEGSHELPRLIREGISPFTPFETNLYWPRIANAPSALAFIARREPNSEKP